MSGAAADGAPGRPEARRAASPYEEVPFIVIWETTRACDLACGARPQPTR
jgi:hypothetical protein